MNFDTITNTPCIPGCGGAGANGSGGSGSGGGTNPTDPRCSDAEFAAANPSVCGSAPYLVLKPATSIIATLGSIQFNAFLYQNGVETALTSNLLFGSSDPTIFVIGASSGNGTGLTPGQVVVTVAYQGMSATATVTVVDSTIGCSETPVATAILIDNSNSMSQLFGGGYRTRFNYAQAVASAYAGNILQVAGQPKDSVCIFSFNDTPAQVSTGFIGDTGQLLADVSSVTQSNGNTDLKSALTAAAAALQATQAAEQVILLISDGEQTDTPTEQDVLTVASAFTQAGGIIICIGCRASGAGFDLLERAATGGFFINATANTSLPVLSGLSYLKSSVCAGVCAAAGDYYIATAELDYSSFLNWSVVGGQVNLIGNGFMDLLPGNGLYVELSANNHPGTIQTIDTFTLNPGDTYEIQFSLAGNNQLYTPAANQSVLVGVVDVNSGQPIFQQTVSAQWNSGFQTQSFSFTAQYAATVRLVFSQQIAAGFTGDFAGDLLDKISFYDATTYVNMLTDDFDDENLKYVPPACGPSAALAALANPAAPAISFINYQGGSQISAETYKYAYSYQTLQGETALSPVASTASLTPVTMQYQSTLLNGIAIDPNTYPPDRIVDIRIWRNDNSASSTLYLLATLTPENVNYVDILDHAQFSAIVDPSIIAPVANTTAVAQGALGSGLSGCYEPPCDPDLGAQVPDPNPLPNIEAGGGGGGQQYNSTQQVCGACPLGSTSINTANVIPVMTGPSAPSGTASASAADAGYDAWQAFGDGVGWRNTNATGWIMYQFPAPLAAVASLYDTTGKVTPSAYNSTLEGSNDGIAFTTIYKRTNDSSSGAALYILFPNDTAYTYYRLSYAITSGGQTFNVNQWQLFTLSTNVPQYCKSAGAISYASQADADSHATATAQALLSAYLATVCVPTFSSTKCFTASCPCGTLANNSSNTQCAMAVSAVSQADADATALADAQAAVQTALVCNQSNNTLQISVLNGTNPNGLILSNPYPSVEFISGFAGNSSQIVLNLTGVKFAGNSYIMLALVSPTGKMIVIYGTSFTGLVQALPVNWTIEDSAGSPLSENNPNPTGNYKPANYIGNDYFQSGLGCLETLYNASGGPKTTLAQMAGDSPNGSWSLWLIRAEDNGFSFSIAGWSLTIT